MDIIQKDNLVCDGCNVGLSDSNDVAIDDSYWLDSGLYCTSCYEKYHKEYAKKNPESLIQEIKKGEDLSQSQLTRPMEFNSW